MWIKSKVVMLPTNKEANYTFFKRKGSTGIYNLIDKNTQLIEDIDTPYHLYFLSDEEIKEGDWFIRKNEIHKCFKIHPQDIEFKPTKDSVYCGVNTFWNKQFCKKIIATTDKSIYKPTTTMSADSFDQIVYSSKEYLPKPSQDFIEVFVQEYNTGRKIEEVMIEYILEHDLRANDKSKEFNHVLKVNHKDNTISIRKIKDSWNREEVIALIKKNTERLTNSWISSDIEWIEENL